MEELQDWSWGNSPGRCQDKSMMAALASSTANATPRALGGESGQPPLPALSGTDAGRSRVGTQLKDAGLALSLYLPGTVAGSRHAPGPQALGPSMMCGLPLSGGHSSWRECGLGQSSNQDPGRAPGSSPSSQQTVAQGALSPEGPGQDLLPEDTILGVRWGQGATCTALCSGAALGVSAEVGQEPGHSPAQELLVWGQRKRR